MISDSRHLKGLVHLFISPSYAVLVMYIPLVGLVPDLNALFIEFKKSRAFFSIVDLKLGLSKSVILTSIEF
jgi:hypothetical protein